jgi:Protein of unknown function (DUF3037)
MDLFYNYALIQFQAHAIRGEQLNVGLVVFQENDVDIRTSKRLDKIRAVSAAIELNSLKSALLNIKALDKFSINEGALSDEARLSRIGELSPFKFTGIGSFSCPATEYETAISSLLQTLVEPEPAILLAKKRTSRLLSDLKSAFKLERVLAQKGEDLTSHRVVSNHKIAEGLSADLVLKNGAMHIIETLDANTDELSLRKVISDVAVSALVFEQARMNFGESETKAKLVYQATSALELIAKPALLAAEHQGAELINWSSNDDRNKFLYYIGSLATPFEKKKKNTQLHIHASTQHKFKLN